MMRQERIELRIEATAIERIDKWRAEQPELPSRSEAIRRLVSTGLSTTQLPTNFATTKLIVYSIAKHDSEKKNDQ